MGALPDGVTHHVPEDVEHYNVDVVVVGSGAGGLAAAVAAAHTGATVLVVEKAAGLGGTTAKSGGVIWVPDNHHQRARGILDDRGQALAYMAAVSAPATYQAEVPDLGLGAWEHSLHEAYIDRSPAVLLELEQLGALRTTLEGTESFPDYHCELPEQAGITGRALAPVGPDGVSAGNGQDIIDQLAAAARRLGVQILTRTAFADLLHNDGRVVGIRAEADTGPIEVQARRGVVLASGGFTHDARRRENHLPARTWGGCAAGTNTGDILAPLEALGVPLHQMDCAWWDQVAIEHTLHGRTDTRAGVWVCPGDSSVLVDLDGRRVVNEKAVYNTRAKVHHGPDAPEVLVLVMDQRCVDLFGNESFAYPIADDDLAAPEHLVTGATWDELVTCLESRLSALELHLQARLGEGFAANLAETIQRYDGYALAGRDPDFRRGEQPIERFFSGPARPGSGPNPTMAPFAQDGPYHAVLLGLGTLDTKGGPRTTPAGQVLGADGSPVEGLYAVGNCAASPSGQGYWAAGATLGPALVFGVAAGRHACTSMTSFRPT
ncbi:MAG TPA: FAD-dependent oxidoreductase [Thermopolyspora sp.]